MPAIKTTRKAGTVRKKDGSTAKKNAAVSKKAKKVTIDDVWAIIAEIGEGNREIQKAIDRMSARVDRTTASV
ncbi:MAG: hypothetical protein LBD48_02940, partial [Treponema sp.]|nr:hypothetical protein [Treponema sp.]